MLKTNSTRTRIDAPYRSLITLAALLLFIWLMGCGEKKTNTEITKRGGVLYFGIETPFQGFDILETGFINPPQSPLINLIVEPLFRMDSSGALIPVLGLTASPASNGPDWEITLRKGVVFHDGTPFNADAVLHHWTRILGPDSTFRGRKVLSPIRGVEKIDDYTVRFVMEHPWPPFLSVISDELLLVSFIPSPKAVDDGIHDRKPVGTGPFVFSKWNSGDHFIVLKNHHYWRKGKPMLNKVVFRTIPDSQTRFASLMSGQLDLITTDRGGLIQKAKEDPALYAYQNQGAGAEIILLNTLRPPLDDVRVRRALAHANSQELHIKLVYGNTVPYVHHPFGEGFECADDGYLEHDLEKAKQLIAEYGKPVELECLHSNTSRGRSIGELLQQLYKKIGVTLKPISISPIPHMMKVRKNDYQLATWRMPPANDHGPRLYTRFHSRSPVKSTTGYNTPELDRLLDLQRIETDPNRRKDILCNIIREINQDAPILYRSGRRFHIVARKKLRNVMDTPGFTVDLASAWIDDQETFNEIAYEIEKNSAAPFECADPGDVEAVKKVVLGSWQGKTDWGPGITLTFKENNTLDGRVESGREFTTKYFICGPELQWLASNGARVVATVSENKKNLEVKYEFGSTSGKFTMASLK